ncbi:HTH-type transcriptional regulator Xre [Paenibacillus konkukensis]|uniref:HTH-type transcriptional regulator Xre n=1 Tax=Paenibacillus konkukensis TaxID=2020716 RepID=A0ABY4RV54_9BACL|nr:helix-turn-helix transcriptional regulator [Paenibacillus konkukensis]UQZ85541.1 HTH-type transcriptional regulator Xre [Paenibacillus konkukensis]
MFGKRLAEIRNKKGISQYELAEHLKFTRAQLANYEQGKREPDFETLITLADYFKVSTDYLLGRVDKPASSAVEEYRNVLFYLGTKEALTEEEAEFLKETLVTYRKVRGKY